MTMTVSSYDPVYTAEREKLLRQHGYVKIERIVKRYPFKLNSFIGVTDDGMYIAVLSDYTMINEMVHAENGPGHYVALARKLEEAFRAFMTFRKMEVMRKKSVRDAVFAWMYTNREIRFVIDGKVVDFGWGCTKEGDWGWIEAYDPEHGEYLVSQGPSMNSILGQMTGYLVNRYAIPVYL